MIGGTTTRKKKIRATIYYVQIPKELGEQKPESTITSAYAYDKIVPVVNEKCVNDVKAPLCVVPI